VRKPVVAVIDYGMGNLRSVAKALELAGANVIVSANAHTIKSADEMVFPGVGAFIPALKKLRDSGLDDVIKESIFCNKPFLGLCLGFQLLFDSSTEGGKRNGLGIFGGSVQRFSFSGANKALKVPHMGWNRVSVHSSVAKNTMFKEIPDGSYFYFVHSYYARPKDSAVVAATSGYGINFCSAVASGKVWGCQFHPEKSGPTGIKLLKNFLNEAS